LRETEWLSEDNSVTAEAKYLHWCESFNKVMDKLMPIKPMRVRKRDVPFLTAEWKMAIRMKCRSAKRYNKNKTEENREIMKAWRNKATRLRRIAV